MTYEQGMSVAYDDVSRVITVFFRGQKYELKDQYKDRTAAIKSGEDLCRRLGWTG